MTKSVLRAIGLPGVISVVKFSSVKIAMEKMKFRGFNDKQNASVKPRRKYQMIFSESAILKNKSVLRAIGLPGVISVVKFSSVKIAMEKMKFRGFNDKQNASVKPRRKYQMIFSESANHNKFLEDFWNT